MESVLHYIQELQRIADDLASSAGSVDIGRYDADCEMFLERLETYVEKECTENYDYLTAKLGEARGNLEYLLRQSNPNGDMTRYQFLVHRGLDNVYRTIKNPGAIVAAEDYGDE